MLVEIYQIKDEKLEEIKYAFAPWRIAQKYFDLNDYNCVYEYIKTSDKGIIVADNDIDILEDIFYRFNMDRPSDFKGHSLSVSDVVILDDDMYYCDSMGWTKIN